MIIESDSTTAVSWANNEHHCPWHLRFEWNKMKSWLPSFKEVRTIHQRREVNEIADILAKQGVLEHDKYIWWDN